MDKLERYVLESFERSFSRGYSKPLQRLWLPQGIASPHRKLRYISSLHGVPAVFAFSTLLTWLGIKIYFVHMAYTSLTWHQIQKHLRALFHVIFLADLALEVVFIFLIALMFVIAWACYVYISIYAWNRRADRLNREGLVPLPIPAEMPGVWPPPPAVSAEDLPRI